MEPAALVARHDAPLIGERAATRGRITRSRRGDTASWRTSPPLRAAHSLNKQSLDAVPMPEHFYEIR